MFAGDMDMDSRVSRKNQKPEISKNEGCGKDENITSDDKAKNRFFENFEIQLFKNRLLCRHV